MLDASARLCSAMAPTQPEVMEWAAKKEAVVELFREPSHGHRGRASNESTMQQPQGDELVDGVRERKRQPDKRGRDGGDNQYSVAAKALREDGGRNHADCQHSRGDGDCQRCDGWCGVEGVDKRRQHSLGDIQPVEYGQPRCQDRDGG